MPRSNESVAMAAFQPSPGSPTIRSARGPRSVEPDLVEFAGAGELPNGPDLDAGLVDGHQQERQALVFGGSGISARQHEDPVSGLRLRRPGLLAFEYPLVAVAPGAGAYGCQIAPGIGLAESLAPLLGAAQDRAAGSAASAPAFPWRSAWVRAGPLRRRRAPVPLPGRTPRARRATALPRRPGRRTLAASRYRSSRLGRAHVPSPGRSSVSVDRSPPSARSSSQRCSSSQPLTSERKRHPARSQ